MNAFKDGDVEHVVTILFGGPLDGERYRLPRVPPTGRFRARSRCP